MKILVTGGLGYIGSHTVVRLLQNDHSVDIVDNLSNSSRNILERIKLITNKTPHFYEADIREPSQLKDILARSMPEAVIHFAGLKAVGESSAKPTLYYENNVLGTINLINAMEHAGCKNMVFSSSATVYGTPQYLPFDEVHPRSATNPYGQTKLDIENMLENLSRSSDEWSIALLRYFNPIGAHQSGLIGDNPQGIPNNLLPFVTRVAKGELPKLQVFGDDFDTEDGTGVRDYIHVEDLAHAHEKALGWTSNNKGCEAFNIGTGSGTSVLEIVKMFEDVNEISVPYIISERRPGDIATSYASCTKASHVLGFDTKHDLASMLRSAWAWEKNNNIKSS